MVTILPEPSPDAPGAPEATFPATIELPTGLIGFPELTRFDLSPADGQGPFFWLRPHTDHGSADGFLLVSPSGLLPDYQPELFDEDAEWLSLGEDAHPWVFNILTLPTDAPERATVNLLGPLVVRRRDGVGKQVILANHQRYSATHALLAQAA